MLNFSSKKPTLMPNENGAVLVFVALCLIVIAGIIGLAIDLNIGLSGSTDQQQLANSLASAAMDAYLSTDSALSQSERLDTTKQRVIEIFERSQNKALYQSFLQNPNQAPSLCLFTGSGTCGDNDQGALVPGYWHTVPPPDSSDPCHNHYPCFVPGDGSTAGDLTAFQVELRQSHTSSIKTTFLRLFGIESIHSEARGTSAVVPRQLVLSVDVSSSVASSTHKLDGVGASQKRAAAYKLKEGIICDSNHQPQPDPCTWPGSDANYCTGIVASPAEQFDFMWRHTPNRGANPDRSSITNHYKEDYHCWHINNDGNGPANYLIDDFQNLTPATGEVFYQGPEPLTSILNAISTSLNVLEQRRNAGDKVQLSFFDTTFFPFREIPYMQPTPQAFALAPIRVGNSDYDEIKALTAPLSSDPSLREVQLTKRFTEHAIFPRSNPLLTSAYRDPNTHVLGDTQDGGVFTNLVGAVRRSADALIRGGNVYARRNVVLFSDFIPNCYENTDPIWCSNDGRTAQDGILSTLHIVDILYTPNKITFNPIVNGDYVRPHTTVPLDGHGNCEWDEDKIRLSVGPPLVNGNFNPHTYINAYGPSCPGSGPPSGGCDDFPPNPPNSYYYYPSYMYGGALDTGGAWGVIRPCCKDASGACQDQKAANRPLSQWCHNIDQDMLSTGDSSNRCPPNPADPAHCAEGYPSKHRWSSEGEIPGITSMVDPQGRLVCDPHGRSESQQMIDYMTKILGSNSIVLVPSQGTFTH